MYEYHVIFGILIVVLVVVALFALVASEENSMNYILVPLGCKVTRWGCCPDKITVRLDPWGTNCFPRV